MKQPVAPFESFVTTSYLDARVYALYDQTYTYCYHPYSHMIHTIEEAARLASLKKIPASIGHFITDWRSLEAV